MTFATGLFSADAFAADVGGGSAGPETYKPAASLAIVVCAGAVVAARVAMRIRVIDRYSPICALSIAIKRPQYIPVAPLRISAFERFTPLIPMSITVSAPHVAPVIGDAALVWTARVLLGDTDVSARLTGEIVIEAAEGAARVAHVSLAPVGVMVSMAALLRMPVTIDYERWIDGMRVGLYRLFTGLVDSPEYDASAHVLTLTCSDARQAKIMAMTRAQIDALTPGAIWSPHIFDRYALSEQYLSDRVSTVAGTVDCDALGALGFSAWSGSVSRTFTEDEILDGSLRPSVVAAAGIRRTRLTITYRYTQAVVRCIAFRYESPSLSDQFYLGLRALTRAAVEQALSGTGATVVGGVNFTEYPAAAVIDRAGVIQAAEPDALCLAAAAWLNRRYSRRVEEVWIVDIGTEGTLSEETRTIAVEWDPTASNTFRLPTNAVTAFATAQQDQPIPYIPPRAALGETIVTYVPPGEPDDSDFELAYAVAVRAAARAVLESQRGAAISFQVALDPVVSLRDFVAVDTDSVSGHGKVTRITHRLAIESGAAVTTIDLETVSAILPTPPAPTRPSIPAAIKAGALMATANTWIGGRVDSRPWDETTMFGYSGNTSSPYSSATRYPEQFSVFVPGIEPEAAGLITVPPTCTTTAGNATISALTSLDGFEPGVWISGAGIPANTRVLSISAANRTATLSAAVTASALLVEVRVSSRQYLSLRRTSYSPTLNRNGPNVGA